jgi:hypothetical protein
MGEARLHIYRCEHPTRTRTMCPFRKHLCYGERQDFYDTMRIFFDCGTFADYGYGYYESPKLYKRINIIKDEEGYTAWVPYADWTMLAREVPLAKARRIAKLRLKKGGHIIERF